MLLQGQIQKNADSKGVLGLGIGGGYSSEELENPFDATGGHFVTCIHVGTDELCLFSLKYKTKIGSH